jgi:hypothetical protein
MTELVVKCAIEFGYCKNFRGPMEMIKRIVIFNVQQTLVVRWLEDFFQTNGIAGFGGLNLFSQLF